MKHTQGTLITGYVRIKIEGNAPELFFQRCVEEGIVVWNVKKTSPTTCEGNIHLSALSIIRKIRRGTGYRLTFKNKKGSPFFIKRLVSRKPLFIALLLSIVFIFIMSNVIWKVQVTGVPKEVEDKIVAQLNEYGIHPGAWMLTIDSPKEIQQNLLNDIPELLWVGVDQRGTTISLEGVEKVVVKEDPPEHPRHLVATKKGVIKNMYVSQGVPKVSVNDFVERGDVLVSGILDDGEEQEAEEEEETVKRNPRLVPAEGEIIANTWYEVTVSVPLVANREVLTGNQKKRYYLKIGDFQLPVWGMTDPPYQHTHRETNENSVQILKWDLPVQIVETTISEKVYEETIRTKEEAIQTGIEQAKNELQLSLGPDAKIVSEKILHQTIDNGKVMLGLYISAEENIVAEQRINERYNQGD